jgi:hypothetical protein
MRFLNDDEVAMALAEALRSSTREGRSAEARARCMLKELRTQGFHFSRLRTAWGDRAGAQAAAARGDGGSGWW